MLKKKKTDVKKAGEDQTLKRQDGDEQAIAADGGQAPLLTHLLALRKVLFVSALAVVIAFFLIYYLAIDQLMAWIIGPIVERGIEIIYTAMSEALVTKFKVGIYVQDWTFSVRPADCISSIRGTVPY